MEEALPVVQQKAATAVMVEKQHLEVEEVVVVLLLEPMAFLQDAVVAVWMVKMRPLPHCFLEEDSSENSPRDFLGNQNRPRQV